MAQVPADAWSMDMVFSDTGDLHGGFYDNNSGVDYHAPIVGSTVTQPPLRIAHVSVEMAPIAKVLFLYYCLVFRPDFAEAFRSQCKRL